MYNDKNLLMHHYYDILTYNLDRQYDLSEGVKISYQSSQEEKAQLPTNQRMFQIKIYRK